MRNSIIYKKHFHWKDLRRRWRGPEAHPCLPHCSVNVTTETSECGRVSFKIPPLNISLLKKKFPFTPLRQSIIVIVQIIALFYGLFYLIRWLYMELCFAPFQSLSCWGWWQESEEGNWQVAMCLEQFLGSKKGHITFFIAFVSKKECWLPWHLQPSIQLKMRQLFFAKKKSLNRSIQFFNARRGSCTVPSRLWLQLCQLNGFWFWI